MVGLSGQNKKALLKGFAKTLNPDFEDIEIRLEALSSYIETLPAEQQKPLGEIYHAISGALHIIGMRIDTGNITLARQVIAQLITSPRIEIFGAALPEEHQILPCIKTLDDKLKFFLEKNPQLAEATSASR